MAKLHKTFESFLEQENTRENLPKHPLQSGSFAVNCMYQKDGAAQSAPFQRIFVDTHGAVCSRNPKLADMTDGEIARRIAKLFDLRPAAIVKKFGLKNPIFEATASYGHFGNRPYTRKEKVWEDGREVEREIEFFGWEKLDAVDLIKQEFGL